MRFGAGGATERLRINSSGNVGINTTSIGQKLTVDGSALARNFDNSKGALLSNDGCLEIYRDDSAPFIDFKTSISEDHDCRIQQASNGLTFMTGGNGSAPERMRIDSSGNVGINGAATANSSTKTLQITDSVTARMLLESTGTGGRKYGWYTSVDGQFAVYDYTANSERLRIDSSGNVGIGETSVSAGLDVKRDVNPVLAIDRGTANTANFNLQYNGTLTGQLGAASNLFQISAAGASTPMAFYVNGAERMRINPSGNVGIAGTPNAAKLLVRQSTVTNAPTRSAALYLENNANCEIQFVGNSSNDCQLRFGTSSNSFKGALEYELDNDNLKAYVNGSERLRINSSGNVGAGTTNPESRLHARADGNDLKSLLFLQNRNGGANAGVQISLSNAINDQSENRLAYIRAFNTGASQNGNHLTFWH